MSEPTVEAPSAPLTRAQAARYLHHIVRSHLEGDFLPQMKAIEGEEGRPENDRLDAKLVQEVGKDFLENLSRIDVALLASEERVILTPAARQIIRGKGGFRSIAGGKR